MYAGRILTTQANQSTPICSRHLKIFQPLWRVRLVKSATRLRQWKGRILKKSVSLPIEFDINLHIFVSRNSHFSLDKHAITVEKFSNAASR